MESDGPLPLVKPMLATLGALPSGPGWATEFKWDGVRTIVYLGRGALKAMWRNALDVSSQYPELEALTAALSGRHAVLDGEVVALDSAGVPRFARLQNRMHVRMPSPALVASTPVRYYVFDVLALDDQPTIDLAYRQRRELLQRLGLNRDAVRTPPAFLDAEPRDVYAAAVDAGLEGTVCKRIGSTYQPGRRSPDWVKVPVGLAQEVLIIGWQPGAGRRSGMIGSLLLAVHGPTGALEYVGKVGTGFTEAMLRDLSARLPALRRPDAPAADVPREHARGARWVEPVLVGEVAFRNWTPDGRLRHPSWRGLRPDRDPGEIVRTGGPP